VGEVRRVGDGEMGRLGDWETGGLGDWGEGEEGEDKLLGMGAFSLIKFR
jgi:hypothetical protein